MGAWSMPSLPSTKPLASSPRQPQLKKTTKQTESTSEGRAEGALRKPTRSQRQSGSSLIAMHLTDTARALWKGRSQQPVTPMKGEASPGLPLPSRNKGESVQLQLHTTLPGPQATDRPTVTHHAGLLLLPWAGTCCVGAPDSRAGQEQGRRAGEEEAGAGSWQGPKASLPALE